MIVMKTKVRAVRCLQVQASAQWLRSPRCCHLQSCGALTRALNCLTLTRSLQSNAGCKAYEPGYSPFGDQNEGL